MLTFRQVERMKNDRRVFTIINTLISRSLQSLFIKVRFRLKLFDFSQFIQQKKILMSFFILFIKIEVDIQIF